MEKELQEGEVKKKAGRPKKEVTELTLLTSILETLKSIDKKLTRVEVPMPKATDMAPLPVLETETKKAVVQESNYPVPAEFREVVETILNKEFGIEVTPLSDRPAFQVTIVVPKHYSNASPEHFKMYGADKRPRVIDYASGVLGVRDWAERVLNNLSQDAKTQIAIAREQVKVA